VREVTRPVRRRLVSESQLDPDLEVLFLEDLSGPLLVHLFRLAVDQELELRGTVLRDEGDRDLGRVDGEVERGGVADGAKDATPVGVFAVEGGLDEGGSGDGRGDLVSAFVGGCALQVEKRVSETSCRKVGRENERKTNLNNDLNELLSSFSVTNNKLSELSGEARQLVPELDVLLRRSLLSDLANPARTVGEGDDGIVRGHVAVDGDRVEGAVDGVGEGVLKVGGSDSGVRGDDPEHGSVRSGRRTHVRVDHPRALVDTDHANLLTAELERPGAKFRERVGGHERLCSVAPCGETATEGRRRRLDTAEDLLDGEELTDDAGRHDESSGPAGRRRGGKERVELLAHCPGVFESLRPSDGVGASRIDDESSGDTSLLGEDFCRNDDGGGDESVASEGPGGAAGSVRDDDAQVELLPVLFDAAVKSGREEAVGELWRGGGLEGEALSLGLGG
jgi:hypothetical protein